MTSVYDLLRQRCGLSQLEASEMHGTRLDTIKSWCSDRRPAPQGAIDELRALYSHIVKAGIEYAREVKRRGPQMDETGTGIYYVGEPLHDRDAIAHGWPNTAACMAAVGVAIAELPRGVSVKLVPRVPGAIQIPRADMDTVGADMPDPAPGGFQSQVNAGPRRRAK